MSEGARVWLVPAGFIPAGSTGAQESHEAICVLNTSAEQARLSVSFYFEDRDPLKEVVVIVPPGRTLHIRTNEMDGVEIPRGVRTRSGSRRAYPSRSGAPGWIRPRRRSRL